MLKFLLAWSVLESLTAVLVLGTAAFLVVLCRGPHPEDL